MDLVTAVALGLVGVFLLFWVWFFFLWEVRNTCALITFLPFVSLQTSITYPCHLFSEIRHPPTWRQELCSLQNHCSGHSSSLCGVCLFQERMMRPPPQESLLRCFTGSLFKVALKKGSFTFLFSSLSVILSEILQYLHDHS